MKLRQKIFTIVLVILILIALIGILIGYFLIGANIIAWFTSRYALWIYFALGAYALIWVGLEIHDRITKL